MEKRKLKKMKVLEPSEEMVLAAESDIPAIGNMAYERMEYPIGCSFRQKWTKIS